MGEVSPEELAKRLAAAIEAHKHLFDDADHAVESDDADESAYAVADGAGADAGRGDADPAPARVVLPEVTALIDYVDEILVGLRARVDEIVDVGDDRDLGDALVAVERVIRAGEAASIRVVDDVARRELHRVDLHAGVTNWIKATVNVDGPTATARRQAGRLLTLLPDAVDRLADGTLGTAQVRQLARTAANPRVRDDVPGAADELLGWAGNDDHQTFVGKCREWEDLHDQDGAHRDAGETHHARSLHLSQVGNEWILTGRMGVIHGEVANEVLEHFLRAELLARRDDPDDNRSVSQCRLDALIAALQAAAVAPLDGKPIDVVVNIVVDHVTFEQQLANLATELIDPLHQRIDRDELFNFFAHPATDGRARVEQVRRMCHTLDGAPVDPVAAAVYALVGHVRRVVVDSAGTVIDLGRRQRCFRGSSREAVLLQASIAGSTRCIWPGCGRRHCQVDHATPWGDHGATCPRNGDLECGWHNINRTTGYTVRRDHNGRWHTYRPDGTEIRAV